MLLDYPVDDRESEPGSFSPLLRREEWIEYLVDDTVVHTGPRIGNRYLHVIAGLEYEVRFYEPVLDFDELGLDDQLAAIRHRVHCVYRQIDQHHLELRGIGLDLLLARIEVNGQLDVFPEEPLEKRLELFDDPVYIDYISLEDLFPAEGEELLRQSRGLDAGPVYIMNGSICRVVLADHAQDKIGASYYRGEDIIEIVGDPSGKGTDRLHLLSLLQLLLQPSGLGDIPHRAHDPRQFLSFD